MSWRSIAFRGSLGLAAVTLVSCGGTDVRDEAWSGDLLKISYYRVNLEAKSKRPEPTYRVVFSDSWKEKFGDNPREPLPKAAPNQVYRGSDRDALIRRYLEKLRDFGLDKLRSRNPDDVNPQSLYALAMDPQTMNTARVITVGTDKSAKSYFASDQPMGADSNTFIQCERYVASVMAGHTIRVGVITDPREKQ